LKENFPEDLEPVKPNLDRQHEIIDAAEALDEPTISDLTKQIEDAAREEAEVDVSDCCHSEDVKSIQPPCRSSVQSSPDDPYYVCGSCGQKCEIETFSRSELEDE